MGRKLKTIYELFSDYEKKKINEVIATLSNEEKELIRIRYGDDLDNPVSVKLTKKQNNRFYYTLIPKMKRRLLKLNNESQLGKENVDKELNKNIEKNEDNVIENVVDLQNLSISEEIKSDTEEVINSDTYIEEDNEIVSITNVVKKDNKAFSKLDELNSLGFFKTPILEGIKMGLSEKERVIILLKFGFIDGKYYRNDDIAKFFGIDETEVEEIIEKVLLLYRENSINQIDQAIEIITKKTLKRK